MSNLLITANVFGYIGLVLIWVQVVFGSRHIFKGFTKDTVLVNKIHKQLGIWGFLLIILHPVLEMIVRLSSWYWLFVPNFYTTAEIFITLGRIALIFVIVIWVTSAIIREKIKWRPWKYIHLISYPTLFLVLFHVPYIGTFFRDYFYVQVFWFVLLVTSLLAIIVRVMRFAGIGKMVYVLSKKEVVSENIILVSFLPKDENIVTANIGQHFYLQFGRFLSEHPFTIMEQNNKTGELTFGIRKVGKTFDRLIALNIGDEIFIDGPYGVFTKEAWNNDEKVVISGGIGVTPFVDLVRNYGSSISYINCNRNIDEAVRRDILIKSKKYLDVLDSYDGEKSMYVRTGRISKELIQEIAGENFLNIKYFVCGSPMFIFIVRDMITSLGVKKDSVYFEELGF